MANDPNDFNEPKVTRSSTDASDGGIGKLAGLLAGAVILFLILAWALGWFSNSDTAATMENSAVSNDDEINDNVSVVPEVAPANN